jgi:glycosyltransferase involved in cell wall biosynthesis
MYNNPLVSINCITYNHELFIRDALEGFLMQKTDFEFEILIHDDASTDNTANIIREYEAKYPDLIKPIYQTENQYSKGNNPNRVYQFPRAKGKYIAMCEGDDYWTDPYKLQKQVDFLEANHEYSACTHYYDMIINNEVVTADNLIERDVVLPDILNSNTSFQTATVVFRREVLFISDFPNIFSGDLFLFVLFSLYGTIKVLPKSMSIYRKHSGGVSSMVTLNHLKKDLNMIDSFFKINPTFPINSLYAHIYYTFLAYPAKISTYDLLKNYSMFSYYISKSEVNINKLRNDAIGILNFRLTALPRRILKITGLLKLK